MVREIDWPVLVRSIAKSVFMAKTEGPTLALATYSVWNLVMYIVRVPPTSSHIQGLPSQRATSYSSILACFNVIKTTSLIISCTKHLNNSFFIHVARLVRIEWVIG